MRETEQKALEFICTYLKEKKILGPHNLIIGEKSRTITFDLTKIKPEVVDEFLSRVEELASLFGLFLNTNLNNELYQKGLKKITVKIWVP